MEHFLTKSQTDPDSINKVPLCESPTRENRRTLGGNDQKIIQLKLDRLFEITENKLSLPSTSIIR